jgi:quercetin 2,3-dioxygenase
VGGNILINRRIVTYNQEEDFSYLKTTSNLSTSIENMSSELCIKELKNITLVPRSGTHNNFKIGEEIIMYVISGELLYSDNIGNLETLSSGNFLYINSMDGITYDIFNSGIDFLDIIEISLYSNNNSYVQKKYNKSPILNKYDFKNPIENQWIYATSSLNGLAPIKSSCDINIYFALLHPNKDLIFTINKDRQGYIFQCYGEIEICTNNSDNITLKGSDSAYISNETFEVKAAIPSNILLIETAT